MMMTDFTQFGLSATLLQSIAELGFETPTPVQSKVLPLLLKGNRDLVALAQTGTGKTAAYGLPLVHLTEGANPATQALILCPTRELCLQISKDLTAYAKHTPAVRVLAVYGGTHIGEQIRSLKRGAHIIVATPGRMNDLLRRECANLQEVKRLVLDEADEMLDMGFQEELESILKEVPAEVQKLLFSATMSKQVAAIAGKYMRDPEEVVLGARNAGSENVSHECYKVHAKDRYLALKRIIDVNPGIYGIVFCRTRAETQEVATGLTADGYNADALHGDLTQDQRDRVMKKFRDRSLQLLVATDVAARGLDVNELTHVINYNLPAEAEGYTHRSGRTGRAGKEGISIVIVNMREEYKIRTIEQIIKKKFQHKSIPSGREVCEAQLRCLLERVKQLDISDPRLEGFMPVITAALAGMSPEETIKRLVLLEFERFLEYYKEAPDLNARDRHANERYSNDRYASDRSPSERRPERDRYAGPGERSEPPAGDLAKLEINLGHRNGLTPGGLISLINRATRGPMLPLGRIRIMDITSYFEVSAEGARDLVINMNRGSFEGRPIRVRAAESDSPEPAYSDSSARGERGPRPPYREHAKPHRFPGSHAHRTPR